MLSTVLLPCKPNSTSKVVFYMQKTKTTKLRMYYFKEVDQLPSTADIHSRYSYFFETFENLSTQDDPKALTALKYMLLCKIMLNLVRV